MPQSEMPQPEMPLPEGETLRAQRYGMVIA